LIPTVDENPEAHQFRAAKISGSWGPSLLFFRNPKQADCNPEFTAGWKV
jgi:hypothetical protein